ncbi:MAG: DUF475 domain-containing protein [Helicobacteraceae bacterium]|nr:DUF475 domain-containing protein [Helicobacteraceae bacterium]
MRHFYASFIVTIVCVTLAAAWGWSSGTGILTAVFLTLILGVMETSLSFDNAVVNASVLKEMDAKWQFIFLTVGIFIAVFGMRLLFPVLIVSIATGSGLFDTALLALNSPEEYSAHLSNSHAAIAAFGGIFLLLVFLSFVLDDGKELHWLGAIEERLSRLGKLDSLEVLIALVTLLCLYFWLPIDEATKAGVLVSGIGGVALFIAVSSLDSLFEDEEKGEQAVKTAKRSGIAAFLYLEVLDASFSFDGVIGAFAITRDIVIIMLGLGIGAMFVRSLTVYLVRKGTLDQFVFLEHGAHYAIGALAIIMLAGIVVHVPEVVTGLIGAAFIAFALLSSAKHNKLKSKQED